MKTILDYIAENSRSTIVLHAAQNPTFMIRLTIGACHLVDKVERSTNTPMGCGWEEVMMKTLVKWMVDERRDPVGQQWVIIPECP